MSTAGAPQSGDVLRGRDPLGDLQDPLSIHSGGNSCSWEAETGAECRRNLHMWVWMGCVHSTLVVQGHALAIVLLVPAVHVQFGGGWVMSPLYILLPVLIFFNFIWNF